jgi:hypothetical protein
MILLTKYNWRDIEIVHETVNHFGLLCDTPHDIYCASISISFTDLEKNITADLAGTRDSSPLHRV